MNAITQAHEAHWAVLVESLAGNHFKCRRCGTTQPVAFAPGVSAQHDAFALAHLRCEKRGARVAA